MNTVWIGDVNLSEGRLKICVPLTAVSQDDLSLCAKAAALEPASQILEWRADWYADLKKKDGIRNGLNQIRACGRRIPVLFTIRTKEEGGEISLDDTVYTALIQEAIEAGADAVDVELSKGSVVLNAVLTAAHRHGIPVIASSHNFQKTPETEKMMEILCSMKNAGADVCKLAVMPNSRADVLSLLTVSCQFHEKYPETPLITMSMGKTGVISRVCGEFCGSVLTFGTVGRASAPGQLAAEELGEILNVLHRSQK